jgi:hypothetical protein
VLEALRVVKVNVSIHAFVQDSYDFDAMATCTSKEDYVTALREFSIAFSNIVSTCRDLRGFGESTEGIKQFIDVGVTLCLSPVLQRKFGDLSQVSICCDRKSESLHPC